MAFNIKFTVKSSELIAAGTQISSLGAQIGGELQEAYSQIQTMSTIWMGSQYDKVATLVNLNKANFNNVIRVLTEDLPRNMEKVAQKYANADGEVCGSVTFSEIKTLDDITPRTHEAGQIEYDEVKVQEYTDGFVDAVNKAIADIETLSTKIPSYWMGWADDAWRGQVSQIQRNVSSSANGVVSVINSQSASARMQLSGAEQSNIDLKEAFDAILDLLRW